MPADPTQTNPAAPSGGGACRDCGHQNIPAARFCANCGVSRNISHKTERTMHCPTCKSVDLRIADRQGIEIDYCPICRGVWLDRGELDKLIERAAAPAAAHYRDDDDDDDDDRRRHAPPPPPGAGHYPQKRKKSFWGEMFDFD